MESDPDLFSQNLQVICLCAQWCQLCTTYRETFETIAARHPQHRFALVDIEDDAALLESVGAVDLTDVMDFPTLLMANHQGILFLGPLNPQAQTLERMIRAGEAGSMAVAIPAVGLAHLQPLLLGVAKRGLWL